MCDGGLLNEVPVNLVSKKKKTIVSDITVKKKQITDKSRKIDVFENIYIIPRMKLIEKDMEEFKNREDVTYIEFHEQHHILDFRKSHLKEMMDAGYKIAMERLKDKR